MLISILTSYYMRIIKAKLDGPNFNNDTWSKAAIEKD